MPPEYPFPSPGLLIEMTWSVLRGKPRSFRQDALRLTRRLKLAVLGQEHIPRSGPGVVLVNHYSSPGFFAGWISLSLSAAVPVDLLWVMTSAWTESGPLWSRLKAALSAPLFPRLAQVYGFIAMPPMPPRPHEVAARTRAVRQLLSTRRRQPPPLLALSPEGQDAPGGALMKPHPGVGRMLAHLADSGCRFYPVGAYEGENTFILDFGPPLALSLPPGLASDEVDCLAAEAVMQAIAACLPEPLRGVYA
jgi:1-acyl-sn-glycerol-3-phosphate acyltransferase